MHPRVSDLKIREEQNELRAKCLLCMYTGGGGNGPIPKLKRFGGFQYFTKLIVELTLRGGASAFCGVFLCSWDSSPG